MGVRSGVSRHQTYFNIRRLVSHDEQTGSVRHTRTLLMKCREIGIKEVYFFKSNEKITGSNDETTQTKHLTTCDPHPFLPL